MINLLQYTILGPKTDLLLAKMGHLLISRFCYRGTGDHRNADGLSRLPISDVNTYDVPVVASMFNMVHMSALSLSHKTLRSASSCDPVVSNVSMFAKCNAHLRRS